MNTAKLNFTNDGKDVSIMFGEGKESISYSNKYEAKQALIELGRDEKITGKEFVALSIELDAAKNLPFGPKMQTTTVIEIVGIGGGSNPFGGGFRSFLSALMFGKLVEHGMEKQFFPEVEEATFIMCPCGGNHGRFHVKDGHVGNRIDSKEEGEIIIAEMIKEKLISPDEVTKLKHEVAESKIPATIKEAEAMENAESN